MARALVDLSFAPREDLNSLADASRTSYAKTSGLVAAAFRDSDAQARKAARSIVLTVDSRAFVAGSMFNLVLMPMQDYLRSFANVTVVVVRGSAADVLGNPGAVDRLRRVIVAEDVAGATDARAALAAAGADVFDAEDYLKRVQPKVLIIDAAHPALSKRLLPDTTVISRMEMIAHSGGDAGFRPPVLGYRQSFVAVPGISRDVAALAGEMGAAPLLARCFCRPPEIKIRRARETGGVKVLAILGSRNAPSVRMAAEMARAWQMQPHVISGFEDGTAGANGASALFAAHNYIESILAGRLAIPDAAIDLSAGQLGLGLCREILELLHVPMVTGSTCAIQRSLDLQADPYRVTTERELWSAIRTFALEPAIALQSRFMRVWQGIEGDRDWHWLSRHSTDVFRAGNAQAN
jgi:hypothetical protein